MIRNVIAVVAGYLVWTVVFLGGAAGVRAARASVHDENGFTSDTLTLLMYLALSVLASLAAGFVTHKTAKSAHTTCVAILAACLLATGVPVQLSAWDDLPVWYNLIFLILLVPVTMLGGRLAGPRRAGWAESEPAT